MKCRRYSFVRDSLWRKVVRFVTFGRFGRTGLKVEHIPSAELVAWPQNWNDSPATARESEGEAG